MSDDSLIVELRRRVAALEAENEALKIVLDGICEHVQNVPYGDLPGEVEALREDAERYRWWRENIDCIEDDRDGITGVAYSRQIPLFGIDKSVTKEQTSAELMDAIADAARKEASNG